MAITAIRSDSYTPIALSIRFFLSALSLIFLLVAQANSAQDPPPNVFVDGQPIVAEDMNENFESLHERIATLEANVATLLAQTPVSGGDGSSTPTTPVVVSPGGNELPVAYVTAGALNSLTPSSEVSIDSVPTLRDANNIVLKVMGNGDSVELANQRFLVLDATDGNLEYSDAVPGQRTTIRFKTDANGLVSYDHVFSFPFYYESNDCSGPAKVDVNEIQPSHGVWLVGTEIFRLPMGDEVASITVASKLDAVFNTCEATDLFLSRAGSLVPYDPSSIKALIAEPLRVVVP